eukprot:2276551-Rhodomonas_salina.1
MRKNTLLVQTALGVCFLAIDFAPARRRGWERRGPSCSRRGRKREGIACYPSLDLVPVVSTRVPDTA